MSWHQKSLLNLKNITAQEFTCTGYWVADILTKLDGGNEVDGWSWREPERLEVCGECSRSVLEIESRKDQLVDWAAGCVDQVQQLSVVSPIQIERCHGALMDGENRDLASSVLAKRPQAFLFTTVFSAHFQPGKHWRTLASVRPRKQTLNLALCLPQTIE